VVDELRRQSILVTELAVAGGGAASTFALDPLAAHAGVPAVAGAAEATSLGNALIQGIALGRFRDLGDARAWAARASDRTP
jgi:sugar (pentulose or hexulose) kinase